VSGRTRAYLLASACVAFLGASEARAENPVEASVADYLGALEAAGLVDITSGSREGLAAALRRAEGLLQAGDALSAAITLYGVVESPAYDIFADFVEYQNAEYTLGVALAAAGAYDSALDYFSRAITRGAESIYFAPAHRKATDVALETRTYRDVLARVEEAAGEQPLSPAVEGERSYLRGRALYAEGDLTGAERELGKVGTRSRMHASALYLRGVIRVRLGDFAAAAEALCKVADSPANDVVAFVVDGRYFQLRDLARLGLGRIAHELEEYDDAYYHYFQVPEDSARLGEALFEAGWSMYQKGELPTARWLIDEFLEVFPSSSLVPEARLLSGYIDLASCEFARAEATFVGLIEDLEPVLAELDAIQRDGDRRRALFGRALAEWRAAQRGDDDAARAAASDDQAIDQVLALLRLDPQFVRLHGAIVGLRAAAGASPHVTRTWRELAHRSTVTAVASVAEELTFDEEELARAGELLEDARRLAADVEGAQRELRRAARAGLIEAEPAREERERLASLAADAAELLRRAEAAARAADGGAARASPPSLAPLITADIERARALETEGLELLRRLEGAAGELSQASVERLHEEVRRVLDRAKLGRIDTVIGQKRELEIEVQDLAAGRYPPELHGKMWEDGLIGEDEEYWPFEGEYWADEYEGWR
jgi:tetratricopeptide (TPR) repeat protein